jgi:hypothetical protein
VDVETLSVGFDVPGLMCLSIFRTGLVLFLWTSAVYLHNLVGPSCFLLARGYCLCHFKHSNLRKSVILREYIQLRKDFLDMRAQFC